MNKEYYTDDINVLVVYCANCGMDTGIATRTTARIALKEMKYSCGACGHDGDCSSGIIREENKDA